MQTVTVLTIAAIAAFLLAQLAVDRFKNAGSQQVEARYHIVLEEIRSSRMRVVFTICAPVKFSMALSR